MPRSTKGWRTLLASSLVIGGFAAAGALAARWPGWGDGLKIAAATIVGGPFGACVAMAAAMLLALRLTNRRVTDMGETGTYNDMPSFLVPVVWAAGYAGAIAGSALFAGIAIHLATGSSDPQFRAPALGGAIGAILCALVVGGTSMLKAAQSPRKLDTIQER